MEVEVTVTGVNELLAKFDKAGAYLGSPRFKAMLFDAGQAYIIAAGQAAPKNTRTLSRGIVANVQGVGSPEARLRIGFAGPASKYAAHVEFGTGASPRTAVNRRFMRWFTTGPGGKTIQQPPGLRGQGGYHVNWARRVLHPGTRPQPFFLKHLPTIGNRLLDIIRKDLQGIWGGVPGA